MFLCAKCLSFLRSNLFLSRLEALYLTYAMLELLFMLPAISKRFCNSLCCYFGNGNESTPVLWHEHFPCLLQKPGNKPEKFRRTVIHIEQPVRATHTDSGVRRKLSWGRFLSMAYDGHLYLLFALGHVTIWRHIHLSKPTFWRSLLT